MYTRGGPAHFKAPPARDFGAGRGPACYPVHMARTPYTAPLGRPVPVRFDIDTAAALRGRAEHLGHTLSDSVRELLALGMKVEAGEPPAGATQDAAREASYRAGYAEASTRWRRSLGALLKNPPAAD